MPPSRRTALVLALVVVTTGCNGPTGGATDVTPVPVPTDVPILPAGERVVVDLANDRRTPHAVSVTLVEGDVPRLEVAWTNGTTTAVATDADGRATIRERAARGEVWSLGLPDDIKSSFAMETAEPGENVTVSVPGGLQNPTVVVEVRPVGDEFPSSGDREPLVLAAVIDCSRGERFESVHISLGRDIDIDRLRSCVPAG